MKNAKNAVAVLPSLVNRQPSRDVSVFELYLDCSEYFAVQSMPAPSAFLFAVRLITMLVRVAQKMQMLSSVNDKGQTALMVAVQTKKMEIVGAVAKLIGETWVPVDEVRGACTSAIKVPVYGISEEVK